MFGEPAGQLRAGDVLVVGTVPRWGRTGLLGLHGRPSRYGYTKRDQPLLPYRTVFALASPDGSGRTPRWRRDHGRTRAGVGGGVRAAAGWRDLVVTPRRGVRVVDGPLTGAHGPRAPHPPMPAAIALEAGRTAAVRRLHLWHESGDGHLVLPVETAHSPSCASNLR
ncbi:hypothetical protein [Streptomyces sp. NPDC059943]|uniref:hypothetical protein n=1 Tax=Streptomyces sp. NPDC059943 TaxID=3347010 RepID=UPI003651F21A